MAKEVRTEIDIAAGPQRVWQIITDFASYPEWNPFIRRVEGEPKQGARITINLTTPGGTNRTYEPVITVIEPARELRWVGKVPGIVKGEHIFELAAAEDGRTRLVHREVFGGLLSPFFGRRTEEDIKAGFEQMNLALKKRAEALR